MDFGKMATAVNDLDTRLEQIINQGKITNGLLALILLSAEGTRKVAGIPQLMSEQERIACIALIRMAFNDPSRILAEATNSLPDEPIRA